jgi:hypothetical protein
VDFLSYDNIAGDSCGIIKNATLYHFGVLTSAMHMAWVRQICGRIKSEYRYSNKLVTENRLGFLFELYDRIINPS